MDPKAVDGSGLVAVAMVCAVLYFAGVKPLQTTYADTVSLKADLWLTKGVLENRSQTENSASKSAAQLEQRLIKLDIQLSDIEQMNARLSEITNLAENAGMTLESVRPGELHSAEKYRAVIIRMVGRIKYKQAGDFLALMHSEHPDTGLSSIQFDRIEGEVGDTGRMHIEMVWYAAPADGQVYTGSAESTGTEVN